MIINHNMSAIFANRELKVNNWALDKNMEKLSSGSRITRAGDDASGLAVSEKMRSQIRGLRQASANAANGISFIQTTEGYLQESQDIMQRHPRAGGAGVQRHLHRRGPDADPGRGLAARRRGRPHRRPTPSSTA